MANTHSLFIELLEELKIPSSKRTRLMNSRDNVRKTIRAYFADKHPSYVPKFYIQGSYKTGTQIRTKDDTCDLDDGVYFLGETDVTGTTLQNWVYDAVDEITDTPSMHKSKCIRVSYKNDYHIDLPVYYREDDQNSPFLAVKNEDWEESDPKAFVNWFNSKIDDDEALRRIVKYLKCWCDFKRQKMPSGLAMSILAANYLHLAERDDESLYHTLKEIENTLAQRFECEVPVAPYDDLFSDYNDTRKDNFLTNLADFIEDLGNAINESSELKASKLIRKHLGPRFPLGEDPEPSKRKVSENSSTLAAAITTSPWNDDFSTK